MELLPFKFQRRPDMTLEEAIVQLILPLAEAVGRLEAKVQNLEYKDEVNSKKIEELVRWRFSNFRHTYREIGTNRDTDG